MAAGTERTGDGDPREVRSDNEAVPLDRTEAAEEMRCGECAEGRRYTENSYYCVMYGFIIREKEKCTRKGARPRGEDDDQGGAVQDKAEQLSGSEGPA